jgi:CheY-like chemotaxis protein
MVPEPKSEPVAAHVLLVEDEVLIRSAIAETLRDVGLLVIEAANADEAWSYLQTGASVDLVFSDIQMPGSMDGIELARKVKENYDHIVIVLTSGRRVPPHGNQDHFISKPYRPANLVMMVKSLLEQK